MSELNAPRRFGPFVLVPERLELHKNGTPVPLRPQPAKALVLLSARAGTIVTREELRALLWADTVVDFDKSLNFVILQLRRALGDPAGRPVYIETVPRIGYRFLASVSLSVSRHPARPVRKLNAWAILAVAIAVLMALRVLVPESVLKTSTRGERSSQARAAYLKGRYLLEKPSRHDFERGVGYLHEAVTADPELAEAWLAIAEVHLRRTLTRGEEGELAKTAVERALRAEPHLALAHVRLGDVRSVVDWNWEGAGRAYERALSLDPSLAEAHHHYATYLMIRGDVDAALRAIERALELDPVSITIRGDAGWKYLYADRYDEAIAHCEKTLELEPSSTYALECLVYAYQKHGRPALALEAARSHLEFLGVDARERDDFDLRTYRRLLLERLEGRGERVSPVDLALAHAAVGESETAVTLLEEAYRRRISRLVFQIRDPRLRGLHTEPSFPELFLSLGITL